MTESHTDTDKKPIPKTEASRGGSGLPPRKTAIGYAGSDDDGEESAAEQMRRERDARREQRLRDREERRRELAAKNEQSAIDFEKQRQELAAKNEQRQKEQAAKTEEMRVERERRRQEEKARNQLLLIEAEKTKREHAERLANNLRKARDEYERLRAAEKKRFPEFLNAIVTLVGCYANCGDEPKVNETFDEAIGLFTSNAIENAGQEGNGWQLWNYTNFLSNSKIESYLLRSFQAAELRRSSGALNELDNNLRGTLQNLESQKYDTRNIWHKIIAIRSSIRGANDHSLERLLTFYAGECERAADLQECESLHKQIINLSEKWTTEGVILSQLGLASFYLRHRKFDESRACWREAEQNCVGVISKSVAVNFSHLLDQHIRLGNMIDVELLIQMLLQNAGDNVITELDRHFEVILDKYLSSGALAKAEALLIKRVAAADHCVEDVRANWWRLKLSEIWLATGKDTDSAKLFEHVKASTALAGLSVNSLIRQRTLLLERLGKSQEGGELKRQITSPASRGPIRIQFPLFATQEIDFGHNTSFDEFDSSQPDVRVHPQVTSAICCLGLMHRRGNFSFNGTIYSTNSPPRPASGRTGHQPSLNTAINFPNFHTASSTDFQAVPPDVDLPTAALLPPITAGSFLLGRHGPWILEGDYRASTLPKGIKVDPQIRGRVRLFLSDDEEPSSVIEINCFDAQNRPVDSQIWYDGPRKIRLNHSVSALIYAPNATVEIPFNGRFKGAIIANRIVGLGNNRYTFDVSLMNEVFE